MGSVSEVNGASRLIDAMNACIQEPTENGHREKRFAEVLRQGETYRNFLKARDVANLSGDEYYARRQQVDRIYRLGKTALFTPHERSKLDSLTLSLKLGGHIPPNLLDDNADFQKFAKANHLRHAFQAVRLTPKVSPAGEILLPFVSEGRTKWVPFHITPSETEPSIRDEQGASLLRLNQDWEIPSDYAITEQGIVKNNIYTDPIIPMMSRHRKDADSDYELELIVSLSKSQRGGVGGISGQHVWFMLRDPENEYSLGKYGPFDEISLMDAACATGKKKGRVMSPDIYAYRALDDRDEYRVKFILSKEQYDQVFKRIKQDRTEEHMSFSVLKGNCTSYAINLLKDEFNIELETKIHCREYLYRQMPPGIQTTLDSIGSAFNWAFPSGIKKVFLFFSFPLRYALSVFSNTLAFAMSQWNHDPIEGTDVHWYDIFTNNVYIEHPSELKKELERKFSAGFVDLREN